MNHRKFLYLYHTQSKIDTSYLQTLLRIGTLLNYTSKRYNPNLSYRHSSLDTHECFCSFHASLTRPLFHPRVEESLRDINQTPLLLLHMLGWPHAHILYTARQDTTLSCLSKLTPGTWPSHSILFWCVLMIKPASLISLTLADRFFTWPVIDQCTQRHKTGLEP